MLFCFKSLDFKAGDYLKSCLSTLLLPLVTLIFLLKIMRTYIEINSYFELIVISFISVAAYTIIYFVFSMKKEEKYTLIRLIRDRFV